jgi:hypothetical protein
MLLLLMYPVPLRPIAYDEGVLMFIGFVLFRFRLTASSGSALRYYAP